MKLEIQIVVKVPAMSSDQRLEMVEGAMAAFRRAFPLAEPLLYPDAPLPVTVTIHTEDEDAQGE